MRGTLEAADFLVFYLISPISPQILYIYIYNFYPPRMLYIGVNRVNRVNLLIFWGFPLVLTSGQIGGVGGKFPLLHFIFFCQRCTKKLFRQLFLTGIFFVKFFLTDFVFVNRVHIAAVVLFDKK